MPKSVYTSPEFLALEEEHIFAKEWLCAGRADGLPEPGRLPDDEDHRRTRHHPARPRRRAARPCPTSAATACRPCCKAAAMSAPSSAPITPGPTTSTAPCAARRPWRPTRRSARTTSRLPPVRVENWLGWIMVTLNPDAPVAPHPTGRGGKPGRPSGHGHLQGNLPRNLPLGHQLEGAGREFHGKLSPAGMPFRHHRRVVST